jgi:tetratricopeptide (TPR) repeat protein
LTLVAVGLICSACITRTGPEVAALEPTSSAALLRIGSVEEELTGSWAPYVKGDGAFKPAMQAALREPGPASHFSSDPSSLTLDVKLTSYHQADEPRLAALGLFSIATLGVIPAYYRSEWDVQLDATVVSGEGIQVAEYHVHEKGTYKILAFPPTMFTLLGAGIKGDADFRRVTEKTANSLANKLMSAIEKDYPRLASLRASNVPSLAALGGGPAALLERGRAHLGAGRLENARADMMRYAEHDVRLLAALTPATVLDFYDADNCRAIAQRAEEQGERAEREGAVLEAFQAYQRAYGWSPAGDAEIAKLRQALVRLYPRLPARPPLPEPARRFFAEGQAFARADDYVGAAESFGKVTTIAPWFPNGQFNLALVQERAGDYGPAILSMETFLKLAPNSRNARVAQDRLYEWRNRVPAAGR